MQVNELVMLSRYETIFSDSKAMLALAQAGEWDKLVEVEQARNVLLAALKNDKAAALADTDLEAKRLEFIRLILIADEETQKLSQTWMIELTGILGSLNTEKKLNQVYDIK